MEFAGTIECQWCENVTIIFVVQHIHCIIIITISVYWWDNLVYINYYLLRGQEIKEEKVGIEYKHRVGTMSGHYEWAL